MDITWTDIPIHGQPESVSVLVETHVWRKIGEKHMANPNEPWDEWVGPPLVADFQALWPLGAQNEADRQTVSNVSDNIRQDALASLQAPLLMKYVYSRLSRPGPSGHPQRLASFGHPEATQRLVLPSGAQAEIRQGGDGAWSLRTCYFDKSEAGRNVPAWQRYRRLVNSLRVRYLSAPGPPGTGTNDPYLKDDCVETGIEFMSPHNWGLEASKPPDPWNHLPPPWPQPPAAPAAPPPGLLRPRSPGGGTTT
jgi:hypothetical protein